MRWFFICLTSLLSLTGIAAGHSNAVTSLDRAIPHFDHIFVIMDENKDAGRVYGSPFAPTLTWLAQTFGNATRFYGEVHPSEANYAALVGGSTLGIHDDDAYYCTPGLQDPFCSNASDAGYVAHESPDKHVGDQLTAAGLTWKGYYESIPANGSLAVVDSLYASKHSGFLNFSSAVHDPQRAKHLVGFDTFERDLAQDTAPNFALVVPNLCDDMHGAFGGPNIPASCRFDHPEELIARGDTMIKKLYTAITLSPLWQKKSNSAIVITFDEDDGSGREGCCGVTPLAGSNFGGGHIATIVITNHHHRHIVDGTPYNHYSLLRTIEDAFGIHSYLGIANESAKGVKAMYPLFALQ